MWPSYSEKLIRSVVKTLRKGGPMSGYRSNKDWGAGPQDWSWTYKFERELEARFKARHAIATNSGTMAIKAALFALNLPPGSEIIVPAYSFSATVAAPLLMGHKPVVVDVDPYDFTIDVAKVKKAITKKTGAIIPVDLFGGLAHYDELSKLGLPIISDHCQAAGAHRDGKYVFGDISCNSGNGGKNIPAGEAGWVLTQNAKWAERMRLFISHAENFDVDWVGENGRMPEMTAILAYHGLLELEERNQRRQELGRHLISSFYRECGFGGCGEGFTQVTARDFGNISFTCHPTADHVAYVFPFLLERNRQLFIKRMKAKGINVGAGYIQPTLNHYKAFRKYARGPLPVVEELSGKTLCLLYDLTPDKSVSYAEKVAEAMRESLE